MSAAAGQARHTLHGGAMHAVGQAWVADSATVTGRVALEADANVWFGVVIRGDDASIRVGAATNVQDGTVIHADPGQDNVIGAGVTIGHRAICHGVRIHDHALIGMGAILLEGSVVGEGAVVGAGAVVKEGFEVPPYALVVGVPARVVKTFEREARLQQARHIANDYRAQARAHADGAWRGQVEA